MGVGRLSLRRVLLLLCLAAIAACGRATPEPRPDIILITVDTLRRDHVSSYGYDRRTTPFLDDLASAGVRFANGYSTSSWTVPSIASLMTALHPDSHGVVSGTVSRGTVRGQQVLSGELIRLPELLRGAGYRTFGITANGHLAADLGYAQGFDRYENLGFGAVAEDVNRKLEEWKEELPGESSYFLWLHYFDPHAPYKPREPWLSRFAPESLVEKPNRLIVNHAARYLELGVGRDSPDFEYVMALYDSEIAYTDDAIRRAAQMLDPNSDHLVIVTSDHGEQFLDHHKFGHQDALWEELIGVPLIVRLPGGRHAGRVVQDRVSLVDIGPSLLEFLGAGVPEQLQGESFMPALEGRRREATGPIVSSLSRHEGKRIDAIVQDDWKLILHSGKRSRELLYNLGKDPGERASVAGSDRLKKLELMARLKEELARFSTGSEPTIAGATEERLEELRSLGYVE